MTQRNVILTISILLLIPYICKAQEKPYNILFIAVDDLNDYLGYMDGHPQVITPNFDRLASESVIFTNAQCPAPKCSPSRAALMTGIYPYENYVPIPFHFREIPSMADKISLPQYFKMNGYYTQGIGKVFHGWGGELADNPYSWNNYRNLFGDRTGFSNSGIYALPQDSSMVFGDSCMTVNGYDLPLLGPTSVLTEEFVDTKSAEWAGEKLHATFYQKPFFLAVGFYKPHIPHYVPAEWFELYQDSILILNENPVNDYDDIPLFIQNHVRLLEYGGFEECGVLDEQLWGYLANISYADYCLGKLLDSLDTSPYKDNTIVVLWSDHGYHIGEKSHVGKNNLWEESSRVPLLIKIPGLTQAGQIEDAPVNLMDLFPTLIELCGLPDTLNIGGRSLLPLLEDERNDYNYPSLTTLDTFSHTIRTKEFRYIRYKDNSEELYDHSIDPNEWDNKINDASYDADRIWLSQQLDDCLQGGNGLLNEIPRVDWLQPYDSNCSYSLSSISEGSPIPLEVEAFDLDGTIDSIEYWINGALYSTTTSSTQVDFFPPATQSTYEIQSRVIDNEGAKTWSRKKYIEIKDCTYSKLKHNNFENGWGYWNDGGSDSRIHGKDSLHAYSGKHCIRLRDGSNSSFVTSNSFDLSDYNEVTVNFTFITKSFDDSTEDFWLQISLDGGENFRTVAAWNYLDDFENQIREFEQVIIPGPFSPDVKFRFRNDTKGYYDLLYLDNINIDGCSSYSLKSENKTKTNFDFLDVFPNPIFQGNILNIRVQKKNQYSDLILYDLNGNILQKYSGNCSIDKCEYSLETKNLSKGIYFLVDTENGMYKKIVIL